MKIYDTQNVYMVEKTDIILDNMTVRYDRQLKDFAENKQHSASCICWLCLWREYENNRKHVGHPYDYFTFLIRDITQEIEDPFIFSGPPSFQDEDIAEIRSPTKKLVKEIIGRLPFSPETRSMLKKQFEKYYRLKNVVDKNFETYYRLRRYHSKRFEELCAELIFKRQKKWRRTATPIATVKLGGGRIGTLTYRAVKYIRIQPGQRTTQRKLQRHLNIQKIVLENIRGLLEENHGIETKKEGRSIVYVRQTG